MDEEEKRSIATLWAPWRSAYIHEPPSPDSSCIFCQFPKEGAPAFRKRHILYCDTEVFVLLNKYPYNPGHLMIVPRLHTSDVSVLSPNTYQHWMGWIPKTVNILKHTLGAEGVNIGMNLGKVAGAGIADHIHMHAVPRWRGDTNFMPVLAGAKVLSEGLESVYEKLFPAFDSAR